MTKRNWADLIGAVGFIAVFIGLWMWTPVAAVIFGGVFFIAIGFGLYIQAEEEGD